MTNFSQTLKTWRNTRRYSQLDLANEANISGRHLSFLETGRAQPSREMVAKLSDALQLPLDARNQLLTNAGFAAHYTKRNWSDDEMIPRNFPPEYSLELCRLIIAPDISPSSRGCHCGHMDRALCRAEIHGLCLLDRI